MMKKHLLRGAAVLLAVLLICPTFAEEDAVMRKINTMTLREKVGQMFMLTSATPAAASPCSARTSCPPTNC